MVKKSKKKTSAAKSSVSKKKVTKKKAAKKKSAKKKVSRKTTSKKITASKATASKAAKKVLKVSEDQKRIMIAAHAYYKWENAGFPHGDDFQHWLDAEREVNEMLNSK